MKYKILSTVVVGGFFILDQFLKWQARHSWSRPVMLNKFFGWNPFFNDGVAFSLPIPGIIIIIITVPIVLAISYLLGKELRKPEAEISSRQILGLVCILAGAISNLLDRVAFHTTVDYLRIFTGVINLADGLIVFGFVVYFLELRKQR